MSGIIPWWGVDHDMDAHPISPRQLFRSKFLIGAHASMRVHDCNVLLFCSHAVLRGPVFLKNIKDLGLCVLSLQQKSEVGIWEIPVAEVWPYALKVAALSQGDGS